MPLRAHIKNLVANKKKKSYISDETQAPAPTTLQTLRDERMGQSVVNPLGNQGTGPIPQDSPNIKIAVTQEAVDLEEDKSKNALVAALDMAIDISLLLREASEASSLLVPLKVSCVAIEKVLQSTRDKLVSDVAFKLFAPQLQSHRLFIEKERQDMATRENTSVSNPPDEVFLDTLKSYLGTLETVRLEVASWDHSKVTLLRVAGQKHQDIVGELADRLDKGFRELVFQVHTSILKRTVDTSSHIARIRLSRLLKDAIGAQGDRVKRLAPGTRLDLIQRLSDWAVSSECKEPIFWLHDEAGTGKSALAAHMARHWEKEGLLAARFFFDRNGGREFRRLDRFCATMMQEMAKNHPLVHAKYLEILENPTAIEGLAFSDAFRPLIFDVAERTSKRLPGALIFVIDALDECHEDEIDALTSAILETISTSQGIRFLLTSRPTENITATLDSVENVGGKGVVLLDVKHGDAQRDHDIAVYVRQTLKDFSIADQNTVIQCASGVFLWATLACETLLRTITPAKTLIKFQNNTPNRTMQILYETVLEAALPASPSSHDLLLLQAVLQGVVLTYSPVSIFSIQTLLPDHKDVEVEGEEFVQFFVKRLGSIMKDGTPFLPIYILHPTFREFIEDQSHGAKFYISPPDGHQSIAVASLALLEQSLMPNILGLDDGVSPLPMWLQPDFEAPSRLSLDTEAPIRYAVAFWATHASLAIGEDEKLTLVISKFIQSKLLVWMEWSSAIKELSECVEGIRRLQWAVRAQGASTVNNFLSRFCADSLRFLLLNNHVIEQCGLQAWMSALVFTPRQSLVFQQFSQRSIRPLPQLLTRYGNVSSNSSRVLWDSKEVFEHASFSPDGRRLLAFGWTTRLWNAKNFKLIKELRNGHIESESATVRMHGAAWSSDSSLIASDGDKRIHLWDGWTGAFKEMLPRRHKSHICHITFVLSNSVVVAVDQDRLLLCWSMTRTKWGPRRTRNMNGPTHTATVTALVSSPDQKIFATFSYDKTIVIWDPETTAMIGSAMLTSDKISSGAFSKDGGQIIAGDKSGTVTIWDVATQTLIHSLASGSKVFTLAISPNGWLLAAGGDQLYLWDIKSGSRLCLPIPVEANCLAFNATGSRLVSGTKDVCIHDIRSNGQAISVDTITLRGHSREIYQVATSLNGRFIASASMDGSLRIWDTDLIDGIDPHDQSDWTHSKVSMLALSRDGTRLISIGEWETFQLWDFMTGQKVGNLFRSPEGDAINIVFSFSNDLWATAQSKDYGSNVFVWRYHDNISAPIAKILPCIQGKIRCMAFGGCNTSLATGGEDNTIRIWELIGYSCTTKFDCGSIPRHIALSLDEQHLASIFLDGNLRLWDLSTHELINSLNVANTESQWDIRFVVFSPDGTNVVLRMRNSIRIYNVMGNMECYASYDQSPFNFTRIPDDAQPMFSSDGKYLFYWTYTFDLSKFPCGQPQEFVHLVPEATIGSPPSPISALSLDVAMEYVYSVRWKSPLLAVPADVDAICWVAHGNTIAFGSRDGRVFILCFPERYI